MTWEDPVREDAYQAGRRAGFEHRERGRGERPWRPEYRSDRSINYVAAAFNLGVAHGHSAASRLDGQAWPNAIGHFFG